MKSAVIKNKVLAYGDWETWAERPWNAFALSLFKSGQKRESMRRIGADVEWPAILFQNGIWYKSLKVWDNFAKQLEKVLDDDKLPFIVTENCENYLEKGKVTVKNLTKEKGDILTRLAKLYDILELDAAYIWMTHGLEHNYRNKLLKEVPKYVTGDVEKFIGDAGYPIKHNSHYFFDQALRGNENLKFVQQKYGWIKIRDLFSEPFSLRELTAERKRLQKEKINKFQRPEVPKQLQKIIKIAQELVYLRTLRTDVMFELVFLARPLLSEAAEHFRIPFSDLRYYSIHDLIAGKPIRFKNATAVSFGPEFALVDGPVLKDKAIKLGKNIEAKGVAANYGQACGRAKIVFHAYEIEKVKKGDILFAPTTAPSFIMGMKRAAAFVTDEGGITSHAAIVSREMNKPCIIGTKIGTKIFKDGDLVEVDANKGIVRKI